jgi:ABC-type glycerol-3-phosphate transport system permease component
MTIPLELDDSAKIDGCGFFGIYWRMLLPLSKPALGMVAVFSFQGRWRDFMSPLIYVNTMDKYTVAMGLNLFRGEFGTDWHWLMAASLTAMVPVLILFFFAQRRFIQGVVFTGLKGAGV